LRRPSLSRYLTNIGILGIQRRENAESCQKLMIEMGERIAASMSTVLELPEEVGNQHPIRNQHPFCCILSSPILINDMSPSYQSMKIQGSKMTLNAYEGASACREWHTEPSLMRIMWSSSEGGHILEVQSEGSESVAVDCGQTRLIILAGQRLESSVSHLRRP